MSRVLFINPPQNHHNKNSTSMYPSGALVLLATLCQNEGHEVNIFDGAVDNTDLRRILADFKPDYACITVNTFQTKDAKKYLKKIKHFDNRIITVVGGPHISACDKNNLEKYYGDVDFYVRGEGEIPILEIVSGKVKPKRLYYTGEPFDLDEIPLPILDLVDLSKYTGVNGTNQKSMFIMASRGCPFHCTYCNKSVFGTKTRFRKPDKIIEEIKHLHNNYGINHIYFQDDTFNLNRRWIEEILNKIIDNGLNEDISYMAPFRANEKLVDKKLLTLVKKANFKTIFYGVESGNQTMLDSMKKGLRIDEIKRAFKLTHEAGIDTVAAFIIGLPGENHRTVYDTYRIWKELKPTYSGFTLATPFPNTEFEKYVRDRGYLLNDDWDDYQCGGSYVKTEELTRKQLQFYGSVFIFGQGNEWIYLLPIWTIAKNRLLCNAAVLAINSYKKYNEWRNGI